MRPITSQPYRVAAPERRRVARALARGLRPLVLNAAVLGTAFVLILWADFALLDPVLDRIDLGSGGFTPVLVGLVAAAMFGLPWLAIYLAWRPIWFAMIRRRVKALAPGPEEFVATVDETGIRVEEAGHASNWLSWSGVSRLLLVGDTLVVARGTFGLMVSVEAIGGRAVLAELVGRISPEARAASDRSLRDGVG